MRDFCKRSYNRLKHSCLKTQRVAHLWWATLKIRIYNYYKDIVYSVNEYGATFSVSLALILISSLIGAIGCTS